MTRWLNSLGGWFMEKLLAGLLPIALTTVPLRLGAALAAVAGPQLRLALDLTLLTPAQRTLLKGELAAKLADPAYSSTLVLGDMRATEVNALVESLALGVQELAVAKLAEMNVVIAPTALAPTYAAFARAVELE